jgi:tRNA dimethylallyltransferase
VNQAAQSGVLPPAIFLMGPTASGKTGLAVSLVESFPMDIISVDSALVYKQMNIGSAKPDAETLARAPHRLIDIREPAEAYSAAEFREDALREMKNITASGRVPLLVGGTMLYFRALQYGLSDLPSADPGLRRVLAQRAESIGWAAMHTELCRLDPVAGARIHPNDPQRIQRALEVIELSGRPLSELQVGGGANSLPYRLLKLVVGPAERAELHRRIKQRFDLMLKAGFEDEIRALYEQGGLHADMPSMRAVGYRQAWRWMEGEFDFETMRERAIIATRQLAKRQLTWLRSEKDAIWYDLTSAEDERQVRQAIRGFLELPAKRTQII